MLERDFTIKRLVAFINERFPDADITFFCN